MSCPYFDSASNGGSGETVSGYTGSSEVSLLAIAIIEYQNFMSGFRLCWKFVR